MTSTLTASSFDITGERPRRLLNFVAGDWVEGAGKFTTLHHAVTGGARFAMRIGAAVQIGARGAA